MRITDLDTHIHLPKLCASISPLDLRILITDGLKSLNEMETCGG